MEPEPSEIDETNRPLEVARTLARAIKAYDYCDFKDSNLWEAYLDDFQEFSENDFKLVHYTETRRLRTLLRKRGVWVENGRNITVAKSLYNTLQEEHPTPWTEDEIKRCLHDEEFTSYAIQRLLETDFGRNPKMYTVYTARDSTPHAATFGSGPTPAFTPSTAPRPGILAFTPSSTFGPGLGSGHSAFIPLAPPSSYPEPPPGPTSALPPLRPNSVPPPGPISGATGFVPAAPTGRAPVATTLSTGHGRELSNLARMYTDEQKYSGENDSLVFKMTIFHDICTRADVPPEARLKAFPTMLKGLALDFYYSNVSISGTATTLDQVCYSIQAYFEGAEHKRSVLSRWNETTLKSTMSKTENDGKSMEVCLLLLIKDLRHLQFGLDPQLRSDEFIHNKLVNACQDIPACQYACFKPSNTLPGLINDLRSSIITFHNAHPAETFFTDRRYHKYPNNKYSKRPQTSRYQHGQPECHGMGRAERCHSEHRKEYLD